MRLPCSPLISMALTADPFSTKDNASNTAVPGCGATAI